MLPGLDGKPGANVLSGKDMCALLDISPPMLTELKRRGIASSHGRDAWDLDATVTAYVRHLRGTASGRGGEEHVANLTAERARLAKEQADAQALKNAALRGELVPAADVERAWGDVLRQVRARILAVPSRLRQSLTLAPADADLIDRELREALTELGNDND